ncbi:MAG TPA: lasso peptide biosynthesis B2 protein [Thermoanaerobaculia bacterium]|nr:lasso peptide biosynthesis B2 protein [Thermoanaerobaculia bacterium]
MPTSQPGLPAPRVREGVLRRLRRLTLPEAWAFARAWGLLLAADLGLRLLPFSRLQRWLTPVRHPLAATGAAEEKMTSRLVWATAAAARHHLYPMRCLPQALCLRWLLGRHGIPSELRIGVERRRGEMRAHAWVERDGRPVGEWAGVTQRWSPLGRIDPAGPAHSV